MVTYSSSSKEHAPRRRNGYGYHAERLRLRPHDLRGRYYHARCGCCGLPACRPSVTQERVSAYGARSVLRIFWCARCGLELGFVVMRTDMRPNPLK